MTENSVLECTVLQVFVFPDECLQAFYQVY